MAAAATGRTTAVGPGRRTATGAAASAAQAAAAAATAGGRGSGGKGKAGGQNTDAKKKTGNCPRFNGRKGCAHKGRDCPEGLPHFCNLCGSWRHGAADCQASAQR